MNEILQLFQSKLFKVALGIQEAEGYFAPGVNDSYPQGSTSYRNNNPGNLRWSRFQSGTADGFAVFPMYLIGFLSMVYLLIEYAAGQVENITPDTTIEQAIGIYNGTVLGSEEASNYLSIIEKVAGVNRTDPISSINT